jgi:hypothetical protein
MKGIWKRDAVMARANFSLWQFWADTCRANRRKLSQDAMPLMVPRTQNESKMSHFSLKSVSLEKQYDNFNVLNFGW